MGKSDNSRREKSQNTGGADAFEQDFPDAAFAKARNEYYASMGTPVVDRARLFILCVVLGLIAVVEGIALIVVTPLKTTEPYVIAVDAPRGVVSNQPREVRRAADYTPERPVLERELFQFVERLYSINSDYPKGVQDGHRQAYAYTRGRASIVFREFMDREQPYQRQKATKGLVRTLEKTTMSFQEDGKLVLIRFKTMERSEDRPTAIVRDWLMTVQFTREQPTTRAELDQNPLGIYVTHFEIVEER
jgi:type IV secretory pathway component VirB8